MEEVDEDGTQPDEEATQPVDDYPLNREPERQGEIILGRGTELIPSLKNSDKRLSRKQVKLVKKGKKLILEAVS